MINDVQKFFILKTNNSPKTTYHFVSGSYRSGNNQYVYYGRIINRVLVSKEARHWTLDLISTTIDEKSCLCPEPLQGLKIRGGGARSAVVGIICPRG